MSLSNRDRSCHLEPTDRIGQTLGSSSLPPCQTSEGGESSLGLLDSNRQDWHIFQLHLVIRDGFCKWRLHVPTRLMNCLNFAATFYLKTRLKCCGASTVRLVSKARFALTRTHILAIPTQSFAYFPACAFVPSLLFFLSIHLSIASYGPQSLLATSCQSYFLVHPARRLSCPYRNHLATFQVTSLLYLNMALATATALRTASPVTARTFMSDKHDTFPDIPEGLEKR